MPDPFMPRAELTIVTLHEDGHTESITGLRLDMSRFNPHLKWSYGVDYPELREVYYRPGFELLAHLERGRPYLHFEVRAPMIPDPATGYTHTVRVRPYRPERELP